MGRASLITDPCTTSQLVATTPSAPLLFLLPCFIFFLLSSSSRLHLHSSRTVHSPNLFTTANICFQYSRYPYHHVPIQQLVWPTEFPRRLPIRCRRPGPTPLGSTQRPAAWIDAALCRRALVSPIPCTWLASRLAPPPRSHAAWSDAPYNSPQASTASAAVDQKAPERARMEGGGSEYISILSNSMLPETD